MKLKKELYAAEMTLFRSMDLEIKKLKIIHKEKLDEILYSIGVDLMALRKAVRGFGNDLKLTKPINREIYLKSNRFIDGFTRPPGYGFLCETFKGEWA